MKKHLFPLALFVSFTIVLFSFAKADSSKLVASARDSSSADSSALVAETSLSEKIYNALDLPQVGLSRQIVDYAVKGYEKLVDSGLVKNPEYLTIVDLSQSSRNKRFYILDMKNENLVRNTYVAHGKNSGIDMAKSFSNNFNSNKSSLGFYVTESTYFGKHGLSLRIHGLENGFNDNAEARSVVVHGASYVNGGRINSAYMGRSFGCPAVPENEYADIINTIKGGSVMFIYGSDSDYLQSSTLLN